MSSENKYSPLLVGSLIISLIGAIVVLVDSFGGTSINTYYGWSSRYIYVGSEYGGVIGSIIILLIGLGLIFTTIISFLGLRSSSFMNEKVVKLAFFVSFGVLTLTLIGVAALGIVYSYNGWWLEGGAYGGFISGILNMVFFYFTFKNISSSFSITSKRAAVEQQPA